MADTPLPTFNRETHAKYTESPNPGFTYGQKVDATEDGKKWLEGEKAGWTVVDPSKEESRLVDLSLSRTSLAYVLMLTYPKSHRNRRIVRSLGFQRAYNHLYD